MGYMVAMGECFACKRIFSFNADLVPSIAIEGVRQPICLDCVNRANLKRQATGMPLIVPLPGAYEAEEC